MWVDIKPSFIIYRFLAPTHSACFLKTGPFCLPPNSKFPPCSCGSSAPLAVLVWNCLCQPWLLEPKRRKGGHLDNSFPQSRNCQSLLHLSRCQFSVWTKLHYYVWMSGRDANLIRISLFSLSHFTSNWDHLTMIPLCSLWISLSPYWIALIC